MIEFGAGFAQNITFGEFNFFQMGVKSEVVRTRQGGKDFVRDRQLAWQHCYW
jgi:hypothetical protein